jgi:ankyrin repeat protein
VRTNNVTHARLLLRYGADVNRRDLFNRAPLHIAMYWDHVEMIRFLLKYGARLDVVDDAKMTVLHYAARYSSLATLQLLAAEDLSCVSPNCRDSKGIHAAGSLSQRSFFHDE